MTLPTQAQVLINEFDADDTSGDDEEFVELYDGGAGGTSLDGMVLVFFNGSTSPNARGAYRVIDLDGFETDANGYFLAANTGVGDIAARVAVNTGVIFPGNGLQNGEDAIGLYAGLDESDFETSMAPFTVPTDIALGGGVELLDGVVYMTSSNGGNPDADSGMIGELGLTGISLDENLTMAKDTSAWGREPDGAGDPLDISQTAWSLFDPPTPGVPNIPSFELDLSFSVASVSEDAGAGAVEVTIARDSDTAAPLVVVFTGNDPTELNFPAEVTIPAGSAEFMFLIDVLDDGAADGTQTVTITADAGDFFPGEASIDITDDGDAATVVINEISGEVEPGHDPNGDGVTDFVGDEFVEIVNVSGAELNLSGWEMGDNEGLRHVFPPGSILPADCAAVVFGRGGFVEGVLADFGNSLVQKASSGSLGLNDSGDSLVIRQGGVERAGASYTNYDATNGDLVRDPELTGEFVSHFLVSPGVPFSPGVRADTGNFCNVTNVLAITGPSEFGEDSGDAVAMYSISRTGDLSTPLTVQLTSNDSSEAVFQTATISIPANLDSVSVPVDAVDDSFVDGAQAVVLGVHSPGFVSGFAGVNVTDSGGDSSYILINEIDVDTPGSDAAEFIELYDGGIGNTSLDGYVVVLFNGANDQVYDVYDLDAFSTNAQGFFVIGAPGVPNVNLTDLPGSTGFLQNGSPDAVALFVGSAADFFIGSPVSGSPVDAIVYGGSGGKGDTLGPALGLGLERIGTDDSDETISRLPDGGMRLDLSEFGDGVPTPGTTNQSVGGESAYTIWAAGFPGIGAPGDDDDCDGLENLMEYALGKNPLDPDRDGFPLAGIVAGQMRITLTKGAEASADPNLSYFVESSGDLTGWSNTDLEVITNNATTLTVGYTGAADRVYLRVRAFLQR